MNPSAVSEETTSTFMLARVDADILHAPAIVEAGTSIEACYEALREAQPDCVLVRDGDRLGVVTGTDLLEALLVEGCARSTDVATLASYDLVTAQVGSYLFSALVAMTRHHIERIVVFDDGQLAGVLELNDILARFATDSHALGVRIERASSIEELAEVSRNMEVLARKLLVQGASVPMIMDLMAALNGRIIAKVFETVVPAEYAQHCCLIVMGSEGRGEQILKTDQDNALIYADDLVWPDREQTMQRLTQTLLDLGYPPCPGNVMVSNPEWVHSVSGWKCRLDDWFKAADGDAMLNLTIFSDAHAVAGKHALFEELRAWLVQRAHNGFGFLSAFAKAALQYPVPLNLFGRLKSGTIDVKRGGIFTLGHGVRTLALDNRVRRTNTYRRLDALVEADVLGADTAHDIGKALSTLVEMRLRSQLERGGQGIGQANDIDTKSLSPLEAERLRDAFNVVKSFRARLTRQYHLEQ